MSPFLLLTKRNMLLYFRDKGSVFFSLLSMVIIIALMLLFLGDIYIDNITAMLAELPGHDTADDKDNAELFLLAWTIAGIIPINAAMVSLSVLSSIIKDKTTGKSGAINSAPVSRSCVTVSYITAACLASVIICSITLVISEIYFCIKGMATFTLAEHIKLLGMITVNSFTYSAIMFLCAMFINSEGAWSGLGTVVGTLIGFLGGIYLPVDNLSDGLVDFLSCTPVLYGTVMFRKVMTRKITETTFSDAPIQMIEETRRMMGIDHNAFGNNITLSTCIIIVLGFGLAFTIIGATAMISKNHKDR